MSLAHVIAEVFADTPLQGNQLAVFEDGPALSGDQMQRLPCALRVRDLSGCGHPPWRRLTGRGVTAAVLLRSGPSAVDQAARRDDGAAVRSADHVLRLMPASRSWAWRPPRTGSAASAATFRETTGSKATGPYSSGSARSTATSARQSPPGATATARSATTFPGSWMERSRRHRARPSDRPAPQARHPQRLSDQQAARARHQPPPIGGHDQPATATRGNLHLESAFRTGTDRTIDKPYSCSSKALSHSDDQARPFPAEITRLDACGTASKIGTAVSCVRGAQRLHGVAG